MNTRPVRYQRRPAEVDAIQVSEANAAHVATWAGGRVEYLASHPVIRLPSTTVVAHVGDFVARHVFPRGKLGPAYVMRAAVMRWAYTAKPGDRGVHRR